jgi:4-amino-4-deoxy-L-arabinose transferase-like glycosyltransferase
LKITSASRILANSIRQSARSIKRLKTENRKLKTVPAYLQPAGLAKRDFLLLLAAVALVYFYGLGRAPLFGADEPRYAEVAREMYARGDLVTPTLGGHTWFEKPALGYWAQMAGFALFGVNERAARLGFALAGWLTVLLVGWVCGRAEARARDGSGGEDDESGAGGLRLACAGVTASSAGLIVFSRAVNFDIVLTASVTLALACYFAAEIEEDARRARLLLAGFYAGVGCALLAKGLVGIVLPFGVAGLYEILRRRPARDHSFRPALPRALRSLAWGVPLALLVAAVWYAPVWCAHGRAFFDEFIVNHHFARFVTNKYHHRQPFYFYLLVTPLLALPWTPLLAGALMDLAGDARAAWRRARGGTGDAPGDGVGAGGGGEVIRRLRLFALAWLAVPVVFFSASQSKLPGYVLPALPGAAVLAGCELWRYARGGRRARHVRAAGFLMLALAAASIYYLIIQQGVSTGCALACAAPLVAGGAWAAFARGSRARIAAVVVGASLLSVMLTVNCAQGRVVRRESVRDLLLAADARGYASAPVVNLYYVERSSEFYAAGRLVYGDDGEPVSFDNLYAAADYARARRDTVLVIVPVKYVELLTARSPVHAEVIGDNTANAVVALHGEVR